MKALVLGGNGFIGKNLVTTLVSNGHSVRIFDFSFSNAFAGNAHVESIKGNFSQVTDFSQILQGVDVVYHLVSTSLPEDGTNKIVGDIYQDVLPTIRLLDAIRKQHGIKKIVFVSSGGTVYGEPHYSPIDEDHPLNPICSYAVQKIMIEKYLFLYQKYHSVNCIVARLANPYGNGQASNKRQGIIPIFIHKLLNGESIDIWGKGDIIRDYIYIDDAVSALAMLAEYVGKYSIFNVGSGHGHSLLQVIGMLSDIMRVPFPKLHFLPVRNCDVHNNVLDISRLKSCINWKPRISLSVGIKMTLNVMAKKKKQEGWSGDANCYAKVSLEG